MGQSDRKSCIDCKQPLGRSALTITGARDWWISMNISYVRALTLLSVSACANVNSSTTQAGNLNQDAAVTSLNATGVACVTDPATQITLCNATSLCPTVSVNTQQFPNCGFRTLQPSFDLECICFGNYLCPVGSPVSSCQEVSALFASKTLNDICNQVSLGYCAQNTGIPNNGTGGAASSCDQTCYSGCVGAPACIVACGC